MWYAFFRSTLKTMLSCKLWWKLWSVQTTTHRRVTLATCGIWAKVALRYRTSITWQELKLLRLLGSTVPDWSPHLCPFLIAQKQIMCRQFWSWTSGMFQRTVYRNCERAAWLVKPCLLAAQLAFWTGIKVTNSRVDLIYIYVDCLKNTHTHTHTCAFTNTFMLVSQRWAVTVRFLGSGNGVMGLVLRVSGWILAGTNTFVKSLYLSFLWPFWFCSMMPSHSLFIYFYCYFILFLISVPLFFKFISLLKSVVMIIRKNNSNILLQDRF